MQIVEMTREFSYNGVRLPDPGTNLTVEQVREIYSATYPDLATAVISGPEAVGDKMVYRFEREIGYKG